MSVYSIDPSAVRSTLTLVASGAAELEVAQAGIDASLSGASTAAADPAAVGAVDAVWSRVGVVLPRVSQHAYSAADGVLDATLAYIDADTEMTSVVVAAAHEAEPR